MSGVRLSIISLPKLDREREILAVCEQFAPESIPPEPYIPLIPAWIAGEPGDLVAAVNSISTLKRQLQPVAITCDNWQRSGELLSGEIIQGKQELSQLRRTILGAQPLQILSTADTSPDESRLIVCRISEERNWQPALNALRQIGTSLGVIDALLLARFLPDGSWQKVAFFPFGVGSVELYEKLPE